MLTKKVFNDFTKKIVKGNTKIAKEYLQSIDCSMYLMTNEKEC